MHTYTTPSEEIAHLVEFIYEINIPHPSTFDENRIVPISMSNICIVIRGTHG